MKAKQFRLIDIISLGKASSNMEFTRPICHVSCIMWRNPKNLPWWLSLKVKRTSTGTDPGKKWRVANFDLKFCLPPPRLWPPRSNRKASILCFCPPCVRQGCFKLSIYQTLVMLQQKHQKILLLQVVIQVAYNFFFLFSFHSPP